MKGIISHNSSSHDAQTTMTEHFSAGASLSHYRIVSKIGEGGMGEVYRATDLNIGRDVAIKVLPKAFSSDPDRLRRFELEAQSAGSLNHPNILVIYHVGVDDGSPYIVSELLEGETLRDKVAGGAVPQRKALDYGLQIAHGLAAAHEKGIIHRDLKPENIFVNKDGRVKILDFGLAKLTQAADDPMHTDLPTRKLQTDPGTVMGTIAYMSPEQVRAKPLDHRTDIFSFGVILYEMLTGKMAFHGDSTADLMSAILREDPPRLSTTNSAVPPALERVIDHCLEKSPEERFHSASDLAFAIEALSTTTVVSGAAPLTGIAARRKPLAWLAWAIAGSMLVVSGVLGYLLWTRSRETPEQTRFLIPAPVKVDDLVQPVISPDGRSVAVVGNFEGKRYLFLRAFDNTELQRLAVTEDAHHPFWSPDSKYIAFFSDNKLRRLDRNGGPVQTICDVPDGNGGTWNSEGTIVFGSFSKELQKVPAAGGVPSIVVPLDTENKEVDHAFPSFLPDGKHVLYLSWRGSPANAEVWVTEITGTSRKKLMVNNSNAAYSDGQLVFARESTLMAQQFDIDSLELSGEPTPIQERVLFTATESFSNFSISKAGVLVFKNGGGDERQLAWFDRSGKKLGALEPPGSYNDVVLSPDGKWAAVQRMNGEQSDIWIFDTVRNISSRFSLTDGVEDDPVFSNDNKFLYYTAGGDGGSRSIVRKAVAGGGPAEAVADAGQRELGDGIDVSFDGKLAVFGSIDDRWI